MGYAENTTVPVDRSISEIRKILTKYKATAFASAENNNKSMVMFEMNNRRIRFVISTPIVGKWRNKKGWIGTQKEVEQEERRLWRCLVLNIKSKLEAVESGISTFEEEFLAHIVLSDGRTMGEFAIPQIGRSYEENIMPPLLGYEDRG